MLNIEKIEKKYDLSGLKYKEFYLWPFLRGVYGPYTLNQNRGIKVPKKKNLFSKIINVKAYKIYFFGVFNIFRQYNYIIFSDTDSLKPVGNKIYDRMAHGVMEFLDVNSFLYVKDFNSNMSFNYKKCIYKSISNHFFILLSRLTFLFVKKIPSKIDILDSINLEYDISIDYEYEINKFLSLYYTYKTLFKIKKPKVVFVTCFTKRSVVKAANDLNIPTIEFQHGVISKNYAYNLPMGCDYSCHPKYLLVYGESEKKIFEKYNYLKNNNNIYVIPNFYVNKISNLKIDLGIPSSYKYKVVVSLQNPVQKEMVDFINNVSKRLPNFFFILVPRLTKTLSDFKLSHNVNKYEEHNFYEIANQCDLHVTAYSTCALEAPVFGLPNIFVNIKGLSKYYYSDFIFDKSYNFLVNNELEFVNLMNDFKFEEKDFIKLAHKDYYSQDQYLLNRFIKILRKEIK
ncbi:hypothetical protein CL657_01880 [bacterium]|nr:hypothetical protein [bacterium]|tara:strand:- start:1061 stop:2425 length:1365 start_codon:yes stop_codon:yes gene_type:complete